MQPRLLIRLLINGSPCSGREPPWFRHTDLLAARGHAVVTTSVSLLQRLRRGSDPRDWQRFVQLYTPLLFRWARRCGAQDADAADLVQDVLALLVHKLPSFSYDGKRSFRAWLRTVL